MRLLPMIDRLARRMCAAEGMLEPSGMTASSGTVYAVCPLVLEDAQQRCCQSTQCECKQLAMIWPCPPSRKLQIMSLHMSKGASTCSAVMAGRDLLAGIQHISKQLEMTAVQEIIT